MYQLNWFAPSEMSFHPYYECHEFYGRTRKIFWIISEISATPPSLLAFGWNTWLQGPGMPECPGITCGAIQINLNWIVWHLLRELARTTSASSAVQTQWLMCCDKKVLDLIQFLWFDSPLGLSMFFFSSPHFKGMHIDSIGDSRSACAKVRHCLSL